MELTARERQLLEAAAELQFDPALDEGLSTADLERPAEALFRYVARLTPEQSKQLQATAFAQAKQRAASLAEVTGSKLGGIFDVSCSQDASISDDDYALASTGHFSGRSTPQRGWRSGLTGDETTGLDLGSLQFTVVMTVMFYIE